MPWAPAPARTTHLSLFIWKCHLLAPLAGSAVMDGAVLALAGDQILPAAPGMGMSVQGMPR